MKPVEYQWFITYEKKPILPPVTSDVDAGYERLLKAYLSLREVYDPTKLEIVEVSVYKPELDNDEKSTE